MLTGTLASQVVFLWQMPHSHLHVLGKILVCGYHLERGRAGEERKRNSKAPWKIFFGLSSGYGFN